MPRLTYIVAGTLLCALSWPGYASDSGADQADACWRKAFLAGDADAEAACYAPDAVLWPPGGPMAMGNKAIHDSYAKFFAEHTVTNVELKRMGSKTMGADSIGWGTYSITYTPKAGGAATTDTGRYTEVVKRIGGHWMYTVDHASADPAAKPAAKP
ncbi:YybH family protein [Dyella subtropica]|uniref:YybH family protein n=1 Tax=Dyella subtropica TaxID=2992127 RepID=UPI00225132D7|nr:nuclear transport factor 2 family protein [Dyella subtropica]